MNFNRSNFPNLESPHLFGGHNDEPFLYNTSDGEIQFYRSDAPTIRSGRRGRSGTLSFRKDRRVCLSTDLSSIDSINGNLYAVRFHWNDTATSDVYEIDPTTGKITVIISDFDPITIFVFFYGRKLLIADDMTVYEPQHDDSFKMYASLKDAVGLGHPLP